MSNEKLFELKQVSIRLVEDAPFLSEEIIDSPQAAVRVIGTEISKFDREVMCVLNLTTKGKPINFSIVSMGAIDYTISSPREMFKSSILSNAGQVILLHNHPSGDVTPSKDDVAVTNRMIDLFDKMGILLSDHIIVGQNEQYYSFYANNMFYHTKQNWSQELSDVQFKVAENMNYGVNEMSLEERLSIIERTSELEKNKQQEAQVQEQNKLEDELAKVKALEPRIKALLKVANKCVEEKIKFLSASETGKLGYGKGYNSYDFFADGFNHHVGFMDVFSYAPTGGIVQNGEVNYLGINNGGFMGKWDFYTNGQETFLQHEDTKERRGLVPDDVKLITPFLKEYDEFENAFYQWIDSFAMELENVPNFGTQEETILSPEHFVFTAHNGQRVELNGADMRRVKRYYEEQCTAEYLRENNQLWTEEKVQAIAVEARKQMYENDYNEQEAINTVLEEFEAHHYVELVSKQVPDSDGFMTDYTMYRDTWTGDYVFILGDKDAYTPENTEADWKCEVETIALEWFSDYKGFEQNYEDNIELAIDKELHIEKTEESVLLRQFAFSNELKKRVTETAVSLVEYIKDVDWYHYVDITEGDELNIADAEKMISLNQTDVIIKELREYNTENRELFVRLSKNVDDLKEATLSVLGDGGQTIMDEYINGKITSQEVQDVLGNTAYQLLSLYKEEEEKFEKSSVCQARELLINLVDLNRDIHIERYQNIEPDIFFSDNDYLAVYQLKEELQDFHFEDYDYFMKKGKDISLADYEPVYIERLTDAPQRNEELYHRFNMDHPEGYVGHSLSVSDIIVKHRFGITDVSFTDSAGFQPIDFFVKEYALETNNLMHLIERDEESYVCKSYDKTTLNLHYTEKLKLHQVGAHVQALDSLDDTYMKRYDVTELKEKIETANQQIAKTELMQTQHTRKPRL